MIKTSAMFSAHAIHVLFRNTLIFLIVLFLALFAWLSVGIEIDTFKVSGYRIDGLYIKLDKKLTLQADKVLIPRRKANPSFHRIDETLEHIKHVLTLFEKIDLKKIVFENNVLAVYYYDNIMQLSSKDYLIRGNVHREGKMLKGEIPILQLRKQHITMRGSFAYDLHEDSLSTKGKFLFQKISGDFNASKIQNKLMFSIKSDTFSDLRSLIDQFTMPPLVRSWIVDKVQAKKYRLLSLSGGGKIENDSFQMDINSLKAKALLSEVSIDYKEGLSPILAPSCVLRYSNDAGLIFDLESPKYRGRNLSGSRVSIVHFRDKNTTLKLALKIESPFDMTVHKILSAYGIRIPVYKKEGLVHTTINVDVKLKQKGVSVETMTQLDEGKIVVNGVPFWVKKGRVSSKKKKVILHDVVLFDTYYKGVLNGEIDLATSKADFMLKIEHFIVKSKDNERLLTIKNKTFPLHLSYKKTLELDIPKLSLHLTYKNKKTILRMKDLNKIKPYLSKTIPIEEGGHLEVATKDFKTYTFKGALKRHACFFYEKENACLTYVPFRGEGNAKNIKFYAFGDRLYYNKLKSRVKVNNLNIDLKRFLAQEENNRANPSEAKKSKKGTKFVIIGKKSHLRYGNYSLHTDSYDIDVKYNGDIQAIGSSDGDIVKFTKTNDVLTLQALRIKDKVLHPLIDFDGLQNGRYSLTKTGNPEKVMKGEIIVEGGVMKDFKAYNNTLALINTIPALATLHSPGYSEEGFAIQSGVITYRMIKRSKIIFDSIYIKGSAATVVGKGEIDLVKKTIHIELGIQVARELGKVVGSIPLVGYILIGKDKSVTVGLQITGTLDKPKVSVSAAKDILSYPLEIIKRTFEAPQQLLAPQ